jgi:hypothetical protein
MMNLKPGDEQGRNLELWLGEWQAELHLRELDQLESLEPEPLRAAPLYGEPQGGAVLKLGGIQLMYPDSPGAWTRPVYLALLAESEPGSWLVAPFSRFSHPALPGELLLTRAELQLRVLCVWNNFHIRKSRLECGWMVDRLAPTDVEAANSLLAALRVGVEPPEALAARLGPGVASPRDPRWEYQREEMELVERLLPNEEAVRRAAIYPLRETALEYRDIAAERDAGDRDGGPVDEDGT